MACCCNNERERLRRAYEEGWRNGCRTCSNGEWYEEGNGCGCGCNRESRRNRGFSEYWENGEGRGCGECWENREGRGGSNCNGCGNCRGTRETENSCGCND